MEAVGNDVFGVHESAEPCFDWWLDALSGREAEVVDRGCDAEGGEVFTRCYFGYYFVFEGCGVEDVAEEVAG